MGRSLQRLLAAGCIAMIFVLGLLAASPVLHDQLHQGQAPAADDGCAVILFANGVSVPLDLIAVPPVPVEWQCEDYFGAADLLLDSPRYLLQPVCGPPIG
jgi:hypothetical protein